MDFPAPCRLESVEEQKTGSFLDGTDCRPRKIEIARLLLQFQRDSDCNKSLFLCRETDSSEKFRDDVFRRMGSALLLNEQKENGVWSF